MQKLLKPRALLVAGFHIVSKMEANLTPTSYYRLLSECDSTANSRSASYFRDIEVGKAQVNERNSEEIFDIILFNIMRLMNDRGFSNEKDDLMSLFSIYLSDGDRTIPVLHRVRNQEKVGRPTAVVNLRDEIDESVWQFMHYAFDEGYWKEGKAKFRFVLIRFGVGKKGKRSGIEHTGEIEIIGPRVNWFGKYRIRRHNNKHLYISAHDQNGKEEMHAEFLGVSERKYIGTDTNAIDKSILYMRGLFHGVRINQSDGSEHEPLIGSKCILRRLDLFGKVTDLEWENFKSTLMNDGETRRCYAFKKSDEEILRSSLTWESLDGEKIIIEQKKKEIFLYLRELVDLLREKIDGEPRDHRESVFYIE